MSIRPTFVLTSLFREVFDVIYQTGGRRFVVLNLAPLERSPIYAPLDKGGAGDNQFWQNKTLYNTTEYSYKMLEYTTTVNLLFGLGIPNNLRLANRWPGAEFTHFDVNQLLVDLINNPSGLDAPANVTGFYHHCQATNNSVCTNAQEPAASFLW
jgi:hypothetical protein